MLGREGDGGITANRLASHCPMKGPFSSGRSFGNKETRGHVSARPVPVLRSKAIARAPAHSPARGAFCSLQGQPCQVMQGAPIQAVCSPERCWLALSSRVKLGVGGGDRHVKASAPVGTLSPDRGAVNQLPVLRGSFQGAVSDGMTT